MLRLINIPRNFGGHLIRSSLREDRPKVGVSAPPQFLFWFNETPGLFTPLPSNSLTSLLSTHPNSGQDQTFSRISVTKELAPFVHFTHHREENQNFQTTSILKALHYGAILAVGYNIFHDKNLACVLQESSKKLRHLDLIPDYLEVPLQLGESQCPLVTIKKQKTALAQPFEPIENKVKEKYEPCQKEPDQFFEFNVEELLDCESSFTSDYSSHESEEFSRNYVKFSKEEQQLMTLQESIPQAVESVLAIQQIKKGDVSGINSLVRSAKLGCSTAMFYLGQVYEHGILVSKNMEEAAKCYKEAAEASHLEAKFNLGVFYLRGDGGCECSEDKGLKLIKEAAEQGLSEAIAALGKSDTNVKSKASALDVSEIEQLFNMGRMMEEHELNDSEDEIFALEFFRVAAQNGHSEAKERYLKLVKHLSQKESLSSQS